MDKEEKIRRNRREQIVRGLVDANIKDRSKIGSIQNNSHFEYNIFNQGKLWYENGFPLEMADEKLRKDMAFIKGYEHGKRLAFISNMDKKSNRR